MGQNRSPTAAEVAAKIARKKGIFIDMFYGGIDVLIDKPMQEVAEHYKSFDKIFVMEEEMMDRLIRDYSVDRRKLWCLHIPDEYYRHDSELVKILENSLNVEIGNVI